MCVDYLFGIDWFVEVVVVFGWCDDIVVVNVQGDELLIDFVFVCDVVLYFVVYLVCVIVIVVYLIYDVVDVFNLNVVKVVFDVQSVVLYFLCVLILWSCDVYQLYWFDVVVMLVLVFLVYWYIGFYVYCVCFLCIYLLFVQVLIEQVEQFEQLCVLWYGECIVVLIIEFVFEVGIDMLVDFVCVQVFFQLGLK